MASMYTYKVIRENAVNGQQGKRAKLYYGYEPLTVGGLYVHLGAGFPGFQRVLELVSKEEIPD